jgi:hypothetical protein
VKCGEHLRPALNEKLPSYEAESNDAAWAPGALRRAWEHFLSRMQNRNLPHDCISERWISGFEERPLNF